MEYGDVDDENSYFEFDDESRESLPTKQLDVPLIDDRPRSLFKSGTAHLSPYRTRKHFEIRSKIAVESKLDLQTFEDAVKRSFRVPVRKIYSRGHEVHEPGSPIPIRPVGSSPVVSRGCSTSQKFNLSTSMYRPLSRDHSGTGTAVLVIIRLMVLLTFVIIFCNALY